MGYTFSLTAAPPGAGIDPQTGLFTWTPADGPATARVTIRVADDGTPALSDARTFTVTVANVAPTATFTASDPVEEGTAATVSFSGASDPSPADTAAGFRYAYDFDDDGMIDVGSLSYALATTSPTAIVPALDDPSRVVRGYVIDKDGDFTNYLATVSVANAPPTATGVTGPVVAEVGQTVDFTLTAADPSPADQASPFTFRIDWDGDGVVDETVTGPSGLSVPHAFSAAGFHTARVLAVDKDGGVGPAASFTIRVGRAFVSGGNLYVFGTPGDDSIAVGGAGGGVVATVNGTSYGHFHPTGRVRVLAGDGNDAVSVGPGVTRPVELYGEGGGDTLTGGSGNDLLDGGNGDDVLDGGLGLLDVLIGGNGDDALADPDGVARAAGGNGRDDIAVFFAFDWGVGVPVAPPAVISGGNGDDTIRVASGSRGVRVEIASDNGKDRVELSGTWTWARVSGGNGKDAFKNRGLGLLELSGIELDE